MTDSIDARRRYFDSLINVVRRPSQVIHFLHFFSRRIFPLVALILWDIAPLHLFFVPLQSREASLFSFRRPLFIVVRPVPSSAELAGW